MPARVSRVSAGIAEKASTMPGMTKCCHEPVPEIGSQPSCRPNVIISIRPSQKRRHRLAEQRHHLHGAVEAGVLAHRGQDAERQRHAAAR